MRKKTLSLIICYAVICLNIFGQNITNTLGISGVFKIKDGTTDYLTVAQSTGQLNILKTVRLENTSGSSVGVIYKGIDRFIHNYGNFNTYVGVNSGNFSVSGGYNSAFGSYSLANITSGSNNSAFGNNSLFFNTSGGNNSSFGYYSLSSNTLGNNNSAFGSQSLFSNTTGLNNSAFGFNVLYYNTTGNSNSAYGNNSLYNNSTGSSNSAFGYSSLYFNNDGINNSALGFQSLYSNTLGDNNSGFGYQSLYFNTTGFLNSAFGSYALTNNTIGHSNTAFGNYSLTNNTTGNSNSAFGTNALLFNSTGINNTAIGYDAQVPSGVLNNQVRIGNTSVTYAGIQVAWTITSDRNLKKNITNSNLGLGFINRLRPVSYTRINDESGKTEYGLIAQEVEDVLKEVGAENTGMLTVADNGEYQLRYNDLLAPMIKAIQELKAEKDDEIALLRKENELLKNQLNEVNRIINGLNNKLPDAKEIKVERNN